jgi:hypothetical protein
LAEPALHVALEESAVAPSTWYTGIGGEQVEERKMSAEQDTSVVTPSEPKWGDPISTIPLERQAELRTLAERQREWWEQEKRDREQSAFWQHFLSGGAALTGAEAFFLAAYALASSYGGLEEAATRLRGTRAPLSSLHLECASLEGAHLEHAGLGEAHLEGALFGSTHSNR